METSRQLMQVQYQISLAEFLEMARLRHRSSVRWKIGLALSAFLLFAGILFYVGDIRDLGVFTFANGILLLAAIFVVRELAFRKFYRRNPKMFAPRTETFSDSGIISDMQLRHAEASWDTFERIAETKNLFLLYYSKDVIGILPKRAFTSQNELDRFRAIVAEKIGNK